MEKFFYWNLFYGKIFLLKFILWKIFLYNFFMEKFFIDPLNYWNFFAKKFILAFSDVRKFFFISFWFRIFLVRNATPGRGAMALKPSPPLPISPSPNSLWNSINRLNIPSVIIPRSDFEELLKGIVGSFRNNKDA